MLNVLLLLLFCSGKLVVWVMFVSTFAVVVSIIVAAIHHKSKTVRVPACIRVCLLVGVANFLCMRSVARQGAASDSSVYVSASGEKVSHGNRASRCQTSSGNINFLGNSERDCVLSDIKYLLHDLRTKMEREEHERLIQDEWQALARIVDRLAFWLCLIGVVIIVAIIFSDVR